MINENITIKKKRVCVYYFYTNKLKTILKKKHAFGRTYVYFKTGLSVFIVLLLSFMLQLPLQAQEVFVTLPILSSENNAYDNHDTIIGFNSSLQDPATSKKLVYFAFKNNLLYDAVLLPNLAAEVYLGKQFSLVVDGNWSWWTFKSDQFHRIQSVGAEFRYWINSPYPLHGHAIGVYSMVGDYDIRLFTKNEDSKGWLSYGSWSAGLSYAYSMPIANRVNLEFGFALGYLGGKYYDYNYCMTHERWEQQAKYSRNYFGPTRVGVSLVWQLGNGYSTKNRGVNSTRGK